METQPVAVLAAARLSQVRNVRDERDPQHAALPNGRTGHRKVDAIGSGSALVATAPEGLWRARNISGSGACYGTAPIAHSHVAMRVRRPREIVAGVAVWHAI